MPPLTSRQLALCAAGAALVLVLGFARLGGGGAAGRPAGAGDEAPIAVDEGPDGGRAVVHVAGAVRRPGVYRVRAGSRVEAAVRLAGGPTRRADLSALNLAAEVADGRQILVPERIRATAGGAAGAGTAAAPAPAPGQPLNLNTATLEQLDTLPGIGPTTAQKILDFRDERDGFGSVEDLADVPGIGPKRLEALREAVTV